jgi:tRNA(Ile)-lysidine synthase
MELWYNNLDLVFPLTVRNRQNGDRIQLSAGTKKVNDLLIDLKIPRDDRANQLVLLNRNQEILWVPGIKISKIAKEGNQKIYLTYRKGK